MDKTNSFISDPGEVGRLHSLGQSRDDVLIIEEYENKCGVFTKRTHTTTMHSGETYKNMWGCGGDLKTGENNYLATLKLSSWLR